MKKIKNWMPVIALAVVAVLAFGNSEKIKADDKDAGSAVVSQDAQTIADGVKIGSVDVSGMTGSDAKNAVTEYINSLKTATFTLTGAEDKTVEATAEDMGVTADVDSAVEKAQAVGKSGSLIRRYKETQDLKKSDVVIDMKLQVDKQKTANLLYANGDSLNVKAVNMGLKRENGVFTVIDGQDGQEVDYVQSVYAINDFLVEQWDGSNNTIQLVVNDVKPEGSEEELAKVKDVLGTFTTKFPLNSAGRTQNVTRGCESINGSVVYPGEEFSADAAMRPYTEDNGYALAASYSNGTTVESFGGGICQVSTTLYNAVIRAELEVTARFNHSMTVGYVDLSADAAIAGDYKDFKFVNNSDAPIYIEGSCSGGVLTFTVYGEETRPANRQVSFESETLETINPEVQYNVTSSQPVGYYHVDQSSHTGYKARLWKVVTVDGVEQSREVFNNSTYKASPKIITVGTGGASEEQAAQIQGAVGSNDEAQIQGAIAAVQGEIAAADPNAQQPADPNAQQQADPNAQQPADPNAQQPAEQQPTDPNAQQSAGQQTTPANSGTNASGTENGAADQAGGTTDSGAQSAPNP